jgi:hypothetical protein
MGKEPVVEIDGLDLFDLITFISKKNKRFIAIILADIEEIVGKDSDTYQQIRKIVLDGFNDYTRSVVRIVFGDIEYRMERGEKD